MPLYQYEGKDANGAAVRGQLAAADEAALYAALKTDGVFLIQCREAEEQGAAVRKLKSMELSEFCRQLASMTGAGITLSLIHI